MIYSAQNPIDMYRIDLNKKFDPVNDIYPYWKNSEQCQYYIGIGLVRFQAWVLDTYKFFIINESGLKVELEGEVIDSAIGFAVTDYVFDSNDLDLGVNYKILCEVAGVAAFASSAFQTKENMCKIEFTNKENKLLNGIFFKDEQTYCNWYDLIKIDNKVERVDDDYERDYKGNRLNVNVTFDEVEDWGIIDSTVIIGTDKDTLISKDKGVNFQFLQRNGIPDNSNSYAANVVKTSYPSNPMDVEVLSPISSTILNSPQDIKKDSNILSLSPKINTDIHKVTCKLTARQYNEILNNPEDVITVNVKDGILTGYVNNIAKIIGKPELTELEILGKYE